MKNEVIMGRYRVLDVLGQGGFGVVLLAADIRVKNRLVAIKQMKAEKLSPDEAAIAEDFFVKEMSLLAFLKHPSIPAIYDYGVVDGVPTLVMEFVNGSTLQHLLDQYGPCDPGMACWIVSQLASTLGYLHRQSPQIIFRDLKPANIMLAPESQVYLIDFGIARLFKPGQKKDTMALGTPSYASPEQINDEAQTSPASDVYSLGIVFHYLLTGKNPAKRPPLAKLPPLPPGYPPQLRDLLQVMTERDSKKRISSMDKVQWVLSQLQSAVQAPPTRIVVEPKKEMPKPVPPIQKNKLLIASASFVAEHGQLAEDRAAVAELVDIVIQNRNIRLNSNIFYHPFGALREEEKKEQFETMLMEATHIALVLTADLVQSPEGRWIVEQVKNRLLPTMVVPMRETTYQPGVLPGNPFGPPIDKVGDRKAALQSIVEYIETQLSTKKERVA